jgi:uncharacterized protein
MEYWLILGGFLAFAGIAGSLIPALPGPTLSFGALLILYFIEGQDVISISSLIFFGVSMLILIALDYFAPLVGAKFFGATKKGLIGALIGGILGIIFFPPFGIFLGSFLGAVLAESLNGKKPEEALRAGVGTFLGSVAMIVLQTIFAIFVAVYFFLKLI